MKRVQVKQKWMAGLAAVSILLSSTTVGAFAAERTSLPDELKNPKYVTVSNNVSVPDTVLFKGVKKGDTVKVYANKVEKQLDVDGNVVKDAEGKDVTTDVLGDLIGSVVAKSAGSATVSIKDGIKTDKVWVSLTNDGKLESDKVLVDIAEEEVTSIVGDENITGLLPGMTLGEVKDENDNPVAGLVTLKKETIDVTADYFAVENNAGLADTFSVLAPAADKKLPIFPEKTTITIYSRKTITEGEEDVYTALGKGLIKKDGTLTLSLKEGLLPSEESEVYIGLARYDASSGDTKHESKDKIKLTVKAEETSKDLTADVKITNNVGKAEEVTVIGSGEDGKILTETDGITPKILVKDVIKVYAADATDNSKPDTSKLLGTGTAKKDGDNLVIKLKEDLAQGDEVYISRTSYGKKESEQTRWISVAVGSSNETDTSDLTADYFWVQNNVGTDYVQVGNADQNARRIPEKTVVTVYAKQTTKDEEGKDKEIYVALGKGTVKKDGTVSIKLTGDLDEQNEGKLYISLKEDNKEESATRIEVSYGKVENSTDLMDTTVQVTKNANQPLTDTMAITIPEIKAKDSVKIYKAEKYENGDLKTFTGSEKLLGSITAKKDGETLTIKLNDVIGKDDTIWISVTTPGKQASQASLTVSNIQGPNGTETVDPNYFEVINNAPPVADILNVKKMPNPIPEKTTVTVYDIEVNDSETLKSAVQLGKGTIKNGIVSITLNTDLTAFDSKRDDSDSAKGHIYVVLQGDNAMPSSAIEIPIASENEANGGMPNARLINNVSIPDEVIVEDLDAKDLITVYKAEAKKGDDGEDKTDANENTIYVKTGIVLATSPAKKSGDTITIKLKDQLSEGDAVAITLTKYGEPEGLDENQIKILVAGSEEVSKAIHKDHVKITNNVGIPDEIEIQGIPEKAIVKIYLGVGENLQPIETGTAKKDGTVLIKFKECLPEIKDAGDPPQLYLSLTEYNKKETRKENWVKIPVPPENTAVKGLTFIITNNVSLPDTVEIKDLKAKDLIKVYSNKVAVIIDENGDREPDRDVPGDILGTATAKKDGESIIIKLKDQLQEGDKIWLSLTRYGHPESMIQAPEVVGRAGSSISATKLSDDSVEIKNYVGMADTITVKGLNEKDLIIAYSAEVVRIEIGRATAKKDGVAIITIKEGLPAEGGKVYLSLTEDNKMEGERIAFTVLSEGSSVDLNPGNIEVINNVTKSDEVHVIGLSEKDIIKVYATESKAKLLGTGTAKKDGTVIIKLKDQITSEFVYISLTEYGLAESDVIEIEVPKEEESDRDIRREDVDVINNINSQGIMDQVIVSNLQAKDKVVVYDAMEKGKKLGEATANKDGIATINVKELPAVEQDWEKSIYLELIEDNKISKGRVEIGIPAESDSQVLSISLKIHNNVDLNPTVEVSGPLFEKDIIKIYEVKADGTRNFLGEGRAKKTNETLTITLNDTAKKSFGEVQETEDGVTKQVEIMATLTSYGKKEVDTTDKIKVPGQRRTLPIAERDQISIVNNDKKADTINVYRLDEKDIITVYDEKGNEIGKGTANKDGKATISIKDLPTIGSQLSIKRKAMNLLQSEAQGWELSVPEVGKTLLPGQTAKVSASTFTVNKPSSSAEGEIYVEINKNLPEGARVKAYVTSKSEKPLEDEGSSNGILKFTGHSGSSLWLSVTDDARGLLESDRVKVTVKTSNNLAQSFKQGELKQAGAQTNASKPSTSSTSTTSTSKQTTTTKLKKSTKLTSKYISALSGGDIYINGLTQGAIITAYDKSGRFLTDAVASRSGEAWLYIGAKHYEKYVWLTKTDPGKAESASLKVTLK